MLEIKNLSILVNLKFLIKDLSFSLNEGDKLAIIGEEGNGKSTLLKAISGSSDYAEIKGTINLKNHKIGYLKQFFDEAELVLKVFDYLFTNQADYYAKIKNYYRYLSELNIKEALIDLPIKALSGGEKVKIGILKLLLDENDILLLDEPSNDLDIETLNWLEGFINRANQPIVYISHDETLLSRTANMILHIEQIKKKQECKHTILKDSYDNYINARFNQIAKQSREAKSQQKEYDQQMQKLKQVKQKVDHELNTISRSDPHGGQLLKKKMKSLKSQESRISKQDIMAMPDYEASINLFFEEVQIPSKKAIIDLEIPELKINQKVLAQNINLKVSGNEHVVIVGKNGIGKTTFIKTVYAELKKRQDIVVGYMPQTYDDVFSNYDNPLDYLAPNADQGTIAKIRSYLGNLNITSEEMLQNLKYLSGGTKAKIFLLKLVIDKCNVLILDEPTRNLSPLSNPVIRKILTAFNGAIISISHDRKYISEVCEIVYELSGTGLKEINKDQII